MKSNKFTVNLVGGAAASLAAGCLIPNSEPAINNTTTAGVNFTMTRAEQPVIDTELFGTSTDDSIQFQVSVSPDRWSGKLDKKFRKLVLDEVRGTLSPEDSLQLQQLEALRSKLVSPRSADEISFQLKRDRILEKMSETMGKYVQFKATNQKRIPAA